MAITYCPLDEIFTMVMINATWIMRIFLNASVSANFCNALFCENVWDFMATSWPPKFACMQYLLISCVFSCASNTVPFSYSFNYMRIVLARLKIFILTEHITEFAMLMMLIRMKYSNFGYDGKATKRSPPGYTMNNYPI